MNRSWNTYQELLEQIVAWKPHLDLAKTEAPAEGRSWYGYDILANFWAIQSLFDQLPEARLDLLRSGHVADIGGADGDLGFFLASLGLRVDLIDWPSTNWNGLEGARALKSRLQADAVSIHEVDLDRQFQLPESRYDLVFLLGILYHLKNPYFILETLADHARFCILSTRIARFAARQSVEIESLPVAYLLGPDECNGDPTNFWIFSETGLLRLVNRCGWEVEAKIRVGDTVQSNPRDSEHDERIYLALKNNRFDQ